MSESSEADTGVWEAYALRYATMARRRSDNFVPVDPHDGPMPMDFFVWLLRRGGRTILVDTGFGEAAARARGRELLRCPIQALRAIDVDPDTITDVVITHLHYDHAGNIDKLPAARFHIQADEVAYATGPCMCHPVMRHPFSVDDVVELVRKVYADRVVFHAGDATIAPGVDLLAIGGHTMGLQSVRVRTARGTVILASDASHYYDNILGGRPFPIVHNVAKMLDGHRRLLAEAGDPRFLVPGHDPQVLARYPRVPGDEIGIVRLHENPTE